MSETASGQVHHRVCVLCEAMCGLEITHDGPQVLGIRGDAADEFSRGHICPKGNALQDLHHDPDRLRTPLRRTADGGFEPVDWDEALDDIADRIVAIQRAHGRDAVGMYVGNPTAHHLGAGLTVFPLAATLQTRNRFSATSQDQLPQSLAALKLFGHFALFPVPDIDRTDLFVCLGGNPLASNGSVMSAPGMRHRLRALQDRGGRFIVIDPRRTESAKLADEHHFIRPGADAWLMLAMLHVLFEEDLVDLGSAAAYVDGLDELERHARTFAPEEAAGVCGIAAEDIRRLAREIAAAPSAAIYGRTGICTQAFGGLAAWLQYVLNIVTGNLDRPGGVMFTTPAVDPLPIAHAVGWSGSFDTFRSRVDDLPEFAGELPTAALAAEIETPGPGQLRALLVHAGNPVLSAPNGNRIDRALDDLELLVCFDFYVTETSRHADYILPAPSPLEMAEYDVVLNIVTVRNVANFSPPMTPAPDTMRQDWEVLGGLTTRLLQRGARGRGGQVAGRLWGFALDHLGVEGLLDAGLRAGSYGLGGQVARLVPSALRRRLPLLAEPAERPDGVPVTGLTLKHLKAHPHGVDLGPLVPRLPERLFTDDKRIRLVDPIYAADLERLRASREGVTDGLILIGRRHLRSNNSWMHNSRRLVKGPARCTLMIHPDDAAARGLADGMDAVVASRAGEITVPVEVTDTVMPGVVSVPHGWGHDRDGVGWTVAREHAGVSVNDVTDDRFLDGLTGTSALNGLTVEVRAATPAEPELVAAGAS